MSSARLSPEEAERARLRALLEATLYVYPDPVPLAWLAHGLGETSELIASLLAEVAAELDHPEHGLMLRLIAGGYRLGTKPEHHLELKEVIGSLPPPAPLTRAALETAAIIAYKQPITAAEVQDIRSIRNSDALHTLLRRKLIAPAGRAKTRGNPVLYRTTRRFLLHFGLKDLAQLPSIRELRPVLGTVLDPESD